MRSEQVPAVGGGEAEQEAVRPEPEPGAGVTVAFMLSMPMGCEAGSLEGEVRAPRGDEAPKRSDGSRSGDATQRQAALAAHLCPQRWWSAAAAPVW